MSHLISNEEFKAAIAGYLKEKNLQVTALAAEIGKPRSTVDGWLHKGIAKNGVRQRTAEAYPQIFRAQPGQTAEPPAQKKVVRSRHLQELLSLMKIEQTRSHLLNLRTLLVWFLFEASADDRNQFRDMLGDEWKNFLELTRAMTNEMAFDISRSEGRLEWVQKS